MESFTFKGYTYSISNISGKAEFDLIYNKLLQKVNQGRSIVKELEKAYRVSPEEIYLIRFDESRRALVPVRVLKEAVDGFLIKSRFDKKDETAQLGISNEISKYSDEIHDVVKKKYALYTENEKKLEEKREEERAAFIVTGDNLLERLAFHPASCDTIRGLLELYDFQYRENRDYKMRVEAGFETIKKLYIDIEKKMNDVMRSEKIHIHRIKHLVPGDIDKDDPPQGFMGLLQQFLFLSVFNTEIEKIWVTMRDYTIKSEDLPVKIMQVIDNVFTIVRNTADLVLSLEKILFPAKSGAVRNAAMQYRLRLFSREVIDIFRDNG